MKNKYNIIYADPPWNFRTWSKKGKGRSAEKHYSVPTLEEICDLPVQDIAADDCALFLWATHPNLLDALKVIEAWNFKYKTVAFTWIKQNKIADTFFIGLGYWTRANPEICLLATKGKPKRILKNVQNLTIARIMEHSKKPDIVRQKIVQLLGDLPRIELYAREKVHGWHSYGNEIESDIIL